MLVEEYEDWWTEDEYPEELTEEIKEKKLSTFGRKKTSLDNILDTRV